MHKHLRVHKQIVFRGVSDDSFACLFILTKALCSTNFSAINYDENIKGAQKYLRTTGDRIGNRTGSTHRQ